ncbi:putative RNA-binding protein [Gregarina niphandrodes]|uniref:RNA-binding protein n=1 Tax=Gregarina niphandrodes TaxID=110365 RepID=A0A023BBI1_GRENI|nr:putative RNA-binding protein [Gregarina niphandrodes]EZG79290.1 putative RNA-binding protein [Gregarina niphandrodes]|eukprot:XP_011129081.1 putative RNA-binding protein [Gregarina niphandrodes]
MDQQAGPPTYISQDAILLPQVTETPEEVTRKVNLGEDGAELGPVPQVEVKLFVGRVPRTMDENSLRPLFGVFGTVTDIMIIKDRGTNTHGGAAFVRMSSLSHADAAIRALNNQWTPEGSTEPLQVRYASGESDKLGMPPEAAAPGVNAAKLFVGSLPRTATEEEVRLLFKPYGAVDEVFIMKDPMTNQSRGCAFVKLAYKEQAHYAIKKLNGTQPLPNAPRALEVRFAESKKTSPPPNSMAPFGMYASAPRNQQQPINSPGLGLAAGALQNMPAAAALQGIPAAAAAAALQGIPTAAAAAAAGMPTNPGLATGMASGLAGGLAGGLAQNGLVASPGGLAGMAATDMAGLGGAFGAGYATNAHPRSSGAWKEYFDNTGRPYYHNEATNKTQWDRPLEFLPLDMRPLQPPLQPQPQMQAQMQAQPQAQMQAQMQTTDNTTSGPAGSNIFVFHVPNDWTHDDLYDAFSAFGPIVSARIATDNLTNRNKGYAFVSYATIPSAVQAVLQMTGYPAGNKRLKVTIKKGEEHFAAPYFPANSPTS